MESRFEEETRKVDRLHLKSVICGEAGIRGCYKKLVQHAHSTIHTCGFTNERARGQGSLLDARPCKYNAKQSTADGQGDSP